MGHAQGADGEPQRHDRRESPSSREASGSAAASALAEFRARQGGKRSAIARISEAPARSGPEGIGKPSIVAVLRGLVPGIELDDSVRGWKPIQCPFHGDRSASASYNTTTQRFRCHKCDIGGDGYDVIGQVERCDFATARARIAGMHGVSLIQVSESGSSSQRSKLTSRRNAQRQRLVRNRYSKRR